MRPRPPRTLRGRLVAVLTVVLTLAFTLAALITVLVVRHVLVDRLDAQLRAAGNRFAVGLEHDDGDADNRPSRFGNVEGQPAGTLGARVLDGKVTEAAVVAGRDSADRVPPAALTQLARLRANSRPASVTLAGLGDYRVLVSEGRDGDRLVTGLPAEPVEETIEKLLGLEIAVFAGTLLVVVLVSTGLVRLMLRPLSRMADTATDVSALPLHSGGVALPHRVPAQKHGSEVDALAEAFNTMLTEVESALTTRDAGEAQLRRFIADASHELRTPVAVVRSHAELARLAAETDGVTLPEQITHSLERITAQSERMGRLVEDLLLLARLDSGRPLARERVDLTRLTLEAAEDVRATAAEHRWQLRLPSRSVWVDGDENALARVAVNLLANAALHTPDGTTVTAEVVVDGDQARLVVTDTGPGMRAELAAHAFDRFVRGDQRHGLSTGSSGLGLPIVAAIVGAHDGQIDLDSGPDGTTVTVTLPADPRDTGDTGHPEESER